MVHALIATIPDAPTDSALRQVLSQLQFWPHSAQTGFASAVGYLMVENLLLRQQVSVSSLKSLHQSEYGKWMLSNSTMDFNISHSVNKVVAVITDEGKVGIDIEQQRPVAWQQYKDMLTTDEWNDLHHSTDADHLFLDIWTKKESFSKAFALGMQLEFCKVSIKGHKGSVAPTAMEGYFYPLMLPGYIAHVCLTIPQNIRTEKFKGIGWSR